MGVHFRHGAFHVAILSCGASHAGDVARVRLYTRLSVFACFNVSHVTVR